MSYLKLQNYLKLFYKKKSAFYVHSEIVNNVINKLSKNRINEVSKKIKVSERSVYYYTRGEKTPSLQSLAKLCSDSDISLLLDKIFRNDFLIGTWGRTGVKLPKRFSKELSYLSAMIIGDGHLNYRSTITITSDSLKHLQFITNLIKRLFSYDSKIYKNRNYFVLHINSKPIFIFFNEIIGIPAGNKSKIVSIPKFVAYHKDFKKSFLQGLFDSDGGVTISKKNAKSILYSSINKKFLLDIQKTLLEFSISIPGPYHSGNKKGYEIRTYKFLEIERFRKVIGSKNPDRLRRLCL